MGEFELPAEVRDLVNRHLASLDHVEVLLRLRREPQRHFSIDAIDQEMNLSRAAIERCVSDLEKVGLVQCDEGGGGYHFAPRTAADRQAVDGLALMYSERPVTLIRAIYARPPRALQSFADAFRLRGSGGGE